MARNLSFRVNLISRSAGQSAVASASYRSGDKLYDQRNDKTFDYSRKQDITHNELMPPEVAPTWATSRNQLWNQVEASEKRKDAQLARDVLAALPRDLNHQQQVGLVREFIKTNFTSKGMIADFSIHEAKASDGKTNPHAHIMLTLRHVDKHGFGKKNRAWNKLTLVQEWRDSFEELANQYLIDAGSDDEITLKSFEKQGIKKTPEQHLGYKADALEKKGQETERGNENRRRRHQNKLAESVKLQEEHPPAPESTPELEPIWGAGAPANDAERRHQSLLQMLVTEQSGSNPRHVLEQMRRVAKRAVDTTVDTAKSVFDKFSTTTRSFVDREVSRRQGKIGHER